jgi:hypothetical protein
VGGGQPEGGGGVKGGGTWAVRRSPRGRRKPGGEDTRGGRSMEVSAGRRRLMQRKTPSIVRGVRVTR